MSSFYKIKNVSCEAAIGTIISFIGTTIPSGWLLCDGRQLNTVDGYNATDFATLASLIGTTLPNLTDTIMLYGKSSVTAAATNAGSNQITLGTANLPSHTHALTINAVSHYHNIAEYYATYGGDSSNHGYSNSENGDVGGSIDPNSTSGTLSTVTDTHTHTITVGNMYGENTTSAPTNAAFDVINPYYTVKMIIRYL